MKYSRILLFLLLPSYLFLLAACSDDDPEWDPYYNWQARNTVWFQSVADSARTAIRQAKAKYGDAWEEHCEWRQYKTLLQAQNYNTGKLTDSICVRIITCGTGDYSPKWSDTVRVSQRGWLMPTTFRLYNSAGVEVDSVRQQVFSQTYYGEFDPATAAPSLAPVSSFNGGFATAVQYMVEGDDWMVYVPSDLAYGATGSGEIPGYSTLVWRIHMAAAYPCNSGVPSWKARRK